MLAQHVEPRRRDERRADVLGSSGAEVWAQLESRSGCELSRLDPAARTARLSAMPVCLDSPALVGDGRIAGIARMAGGQPDPHGDEELVLVDPETLAVTSVTHGPAREEVVHVAHGERPRPVFNRRLEDWPEEFDVHVYRRVVCWTDLPPR